MVYAYSKYEYTINENCISLCNGETKKYSGQTKSQCDDRIKCALFLKSVPLSVSVFLDVVKVLL